MPTPVYKLVLDCVRQRLTDPSQGFNPSYAAIALTYGAKPVSINFADKSLSFYLGRLTPESIGDAGNPKFPLLTLDVGFAQPLGQSQWLIGGQFSGNVQAVIDVHFTWPESAPVDFLTTPMAIADALVATFNAPPENWFVGTGLLYASTSVNLAPVRKSGSSWLRTTTAILNFEVYV